MLAYLVARGGTPVLRDDAAQALWPDGKLTRVGGGYLRIAGLAGGGCSPDRKIGIPKHGEMLGEI